MTLCDHKSPASVGLSCIEQAGHKGPHQNGPCYWPQEEQPAAGQQCDHRAPANRAIRCSLPHGHDMPHVSGIGRWTDADEKRPWDEATVAKQERRNHIESWARDIANRAYSHLERLHAEDMEKIMEPQGEQQAMGGVPAYDLSRGRTPDFACPDPPDLLYLNVVHRLETAHLKRAECLREIDQLAKLKSLLFQPERNKTIDELRTELGL